MVWSHYIIGDELVTNQLFVDGSEVLDMMKVKCWQKAKMKINKRFKNIQ